MDKEVEGMNWGFFTSLRLAMGLCPIGWTFFLISSYHLFSKLDVLRLTEMTVAVGSCSVSFVAES